MAAPGAHRVGAYARVAGLEQTSSLNGEIGELLRLDEAGRWVVRVRSGLRALRPEFLHPAAAELPEAARRGLGAAAVATAHLLLEVARSGGHRAPSAALLPLSVLIWIVTTLAGCYWLHKPLSSPETVLPGISELGIAPPARGVYRGGSAAVGLLLACTIRLYASLLLPQLVDSASASRAAESTNMGYVAALGAAVQGVFTLDTGLSAQTLLHFAGAIAFVLGTMWHAAASNALFSDLRDVPLADAAAARAAVGARRACLEGLPFVMLLLPAGLQAWHGVMGSTSKAKAVKLQSMIGIAQWALVLNCAIFYGTYALDFWVVLESS